jgi:hypothetical protein
MRHHRRHHNAHFGMGAILPSTIVPTGFHFSDITKDAFKMAAAGGVAALIAKSVGASILGTATAGIGGVVLGSYILKQHLGA